MTGIAAMTVMAAVAKKMAIAVVTVMTSMTAVVLGLCGDGRQG